MKKGVAAAAAVSSLIGGILGSSGAFVDLYFSFFPDQRPVARGEIAADVRVLAVERDVSWNEYSKRTARAADPCEARIRRTLLGNIAYVQVKTTGFKARPTQLRWAVYNRRGLRVARDYYADQAVLPTRAAPVDRSIYPAWTPVPVGKGKYFVRFELLTQKTAPKQDRVDPQTKQLKTSDSCKPLDQQTGVSEPPVMLALTDTKPLRGQRRFARGSLSLETLERRAPAKEIERRLRDR